MERTFAKIENDEVVQVVVADSLEWCESNLGGEWIECGGNTGRRATGVGHIFHRGKGDFYSKKKFDSWTLDENKLEWVSPKVKPKRKANEISSWDEKTKDWKVIKL